MYVLTEITFLPQKAWVVSSVACAEALFAVLHTTCRPNYAMPRSCRRATRPEWQQGLLIVLPLIKPFFLNPVSPLTPVPPLFPLPLGAPMFLHAVDCCWHAAPSTFSWSVKAPAFSERRGWYVLCCQWAVCLLGLILAQSTGLYFQDLKGQQYNTNCLIYYISQWS